MTNSIKATNANAKTGMNQTEKADSLLKKANAKATTSPVPKPPKPAIKNQQDSINAIQKSDFIKAELLAVAEMNIGKGKNALIFKSYLQGKNNASVTMLVNLGYDFESIVSVKACKATTLINRKVKLNKAIRKDYLYKMAQLFNSLAKEPTVKKIESIKKFDSENSGIIKVIVDKKITDVIFKENSDFDKLMQALPPFLNLNYVEKITDFKEPSKTDNDSESDNPRLDVESPMIETDNFNHIKAYIDNDADIATLELMQALITAKLSSIKTANAA